MNKLSFELLLFLLFFVFQVKFVDAMENGENAGKEVVIEIDMSEKTNNPIFIPSGKVVGEKTFGGHEFSESKINNKIGRLRENLEKDLDDLENGVCSEDLDDLAKNLAKIILDKDIGKDYNYDDLVSLCKKVITKKKHIEIGIAKFCKIKSEQFKSKGGTVDELEENFKESLEKVTEEVISNFANFLLSDNKEKDSRLNHESCRADINQGQAADERERANSNRKWARWMAIASMVTTSGGIIISSIITSLLEK